MSLSARLVLRPSRLLAVGESLVALGGLAVAATALAVRWPAWSSAILIIALASGLLATTLIRRRASAVVVVSDRPEVGLLTDDERANAGDSWRLAEGTMVWSGFSVITLSREGRPRRTLPVLDRDLDPDDRRALHRFLLWTMRGGAGRRPADA